MTLIVDMCSLSVLSHEMRNPPKKCNGNKIKRLYNPLAQAALLSLSLHIAPSFIRSGHLLLFLLMHLREHAINISHGSIDRE